MRGDMMPTADSMGDSLEPSTPEEVKALIARVLSGDITRYTCGAIVVEQMYGGVRLSKSAAGLLLRSSGN